MIMLGDDLMKDKVPLTKQLDKTHAPTLAVMKMPHKEVFKYGLIAPEGKIADDLYNVKRVLSKSQQLISHQVIWLLLDVIF